jgi:hypothetical protein
VLTEGESVGWDVGGAVVGALATSATVLPTRTT